MPVGLSAYVLWPAALTRRIIGGVSSAVCRGVALAVVTAALGGCGGSHQKVSWRSTASTSSTAGVPFTPTSDLPRSPNGPITCTVYVSGLATQVIFVSRRFDVRPECRQWSHTNTGQGYLWGFESTRAITSGATEACYLANIERTVTARVIEATGFSRVSAAERASALSACASILASGWSAVRPAAAGRGSPSEVEGG